MKRFLFIIFLVMLSGLSGYAQSANPAYGQALRQAIEKETVATARITLLQKLGNYYITKYTVAKKNEDVDSAITVLKQAVDLCAATHQYNRKYENIESVASAYLYLNDTTSARFYIMQAVRFYTQVRQFKKVVLAWMNYGYVANQAVLHPLAMQCYRQALAAEHKYNLHDDELYIRGNMASVMSVTESENETIKFCLSTIADFKHRNKNLDNIYLLLANIYRYKGDLKKSLGYSLAGVKDMEYHKDTLNADNYYGELALTYEALGQTEKSVIYYKKTLAIRENEAIPEEYIYRTGGFITKGLIKLGRANEALTEALSFEFLHPPKTPAGKAYMAQNKAYCYQALKVYAKAERYFLEMTKGLDLTRHNDEIVDLALYDISNFYLERRQYDKAQVYAHQMGNLAALDTYKNAEYLRFKIDSATGKYQSALTHYGNYQRARDSLFNESKSKQIEELQIKYETGQKEKAIELLKKDRQSQFDKVTQANNMMNLTFAGIVLLLAVLGLLYKSQLSNQKRSKEIALNNASLNALLTEKDNLLEEKEWLMKEIHHRVKNNLQIVMGLLQKQSTFVNNKEALIAIRNSEHRMHSIALIHQKLYQSDNLTLVNMGDYIGEMIGYLRDSFDLGDRIGFEKQVADISFEISIAVPLGLILNEAVTNAIKYAFPTHQYGLIRISLNPTGHNSYLLQIRDNGCGLPADVDVQKINSMGFNLMRGLSKQLGGKLATLDNKGLTISINFKTDEHAR